MNCKKCNNLFEPSKGLISYCSLACRNSRVRNEESKKRTSIAMLNSQKAKEVLKLMQENNKGKHYVERFEITCTVCNEKIITTKFRNQKYHSNCWRLVAGGLREGSGRGKKCWYESKIAGRVYVRSTYELEYVKWLDSNNINWKGNKEKFEYQWEGKTRYYYPDFYLIDEDCYIEIKGFETKKDKEKWKCFPYKLKILKYKELKELGLNIKNY